MKPGTRWLFPFFGTFLATALATSGAIYASWGEERAEEVVVARVEGKEWWRHVTVQELRTAVEDSTELPAGAVVLDVAPVARDSTRVVDRYGAGGDTVYRSEPVYVPRYRYQVRRWVDTLHTRQGTGDEPPGWPQVTLHPGQREGERSGYYRMYFVTDDGSHHNTTVEWRDFARWRVGQAVRLSVDRRYARVRLLGGLESEVPGRVLSPES